MPTAIVIAPGRGSYRKESLGTLQHNSTIIDIADEVRKQNHRPTIRELDAKDKFSSKFHVAGENSSLLTATASFSDFEQISTNYDIVAVCGNSMGHYTALGLSGALSTKETFELIDTMGGYQENNQIGGQLIYPITHDDWTIDPVKQNMIHNICDVIPDLYVSIFLGGNVVLGGTKQALDTAIKKLPTIQNGTHQFPLLLPLHSAFHTPLLETTSQQAQFDLQNIHIQQPHIPIIDGQGKIWRPHSSDLTQLWKYTLTHQVTKTYDFTKMIRTGLRNFAPDVFICLGPTNSIGSAVAQVCIEETWWDIRTKTDFLQHQNQSPTILSFDRPEQLSLIQNPK